MYFVVLFIFLLLLAEVGAYVWHRYGAHSGIDPIGATQVHQWHHNVQGDPAHYDFAYILVFLMIYGVVLLWAYTQHLITRPLALTLYLAPVTASVWNWYVHAAYHTPGHWLERYEWFRQDRELHWQHHRDPSTNFGIASHFSDVLGDSFNYGYLNDI